MRIAVAGLNHETHTFLPNTTPLEQFQIQRAQDIITLNRGCNNSMGGFIDILETESIELIPIFMAYGGVSGLVEDEAYFSFRAEICASFSSLQGKLDGVLLALHGAMVSESVQSTETDLVHAIRQTIGPLIPIMVALDLHGNLDPAIMQEANALFGYHESPHTDAAQTGRRAAKALLRQLRQGIEVYTAMDKPGLVIPSVFSATGISPAKDIMDRVRFWQWQDGVIDVSFFFGFAWSDVAQLGAAAVAVAESPALAKKITTDLSLLAWSLREGLTKGKNIYTVKDGVALAISKAEKANKPIIILDHSDRLSDTTFVLHELLAQNAIDAAHPLLCDPEAAIICRNVGAGHHVKLCVGSKSSCLAGGPVDIEGEVLWVGEKTYIGTGPMNKGKRITLGLTAIVKTQGVWLQITSSMHSLIDTDPITEFGSRADDFKIIVTKSKTHFRAVYEDVGEEIIIVDAPAYSPIDLSAFTYVNAPPTLYPFMR